MRDVIFCQSQLNLARNYTDQELCAYFGCCSEKSDYGGPANHDTCTHKQALMDEHTHAHTHTHGQIGTDKHVPARTQRLSYTHTPHDRSQRQPKESQRQTRHVHALRVHVCVHGVHVCVRMYACACVFYKDVSARAGVCYRATRVALGYDSSTSTSNSTSACV